MTNKLCLAMLLLCFSANGQTRSLDFFLGKVVSNSPLLKDYYNQVLSNQADSALLRASYRTQVGVNTNASYSPVIHGYGYDNAITNGANVVGVVQATHAFVSRGNLANQYEQLRLQWQTLQASAQVSEQDLKRTIVAQYVVVYGDVLMMRFNTEITQLMGKEERLLKVLTQQNVYKQADYLTFLVSYQQQQLTNRQMELQYGNDYGTLNYLCGIQDTVYSKPITDPELTVQMLPQLEQSVFYRSYTIDSLLTLNGKAGIDYSYKPRLNAYVDAGYNSSLAVDYYKNFGASVGLSLLVPIYDGHQRKMKYRKLALAELTRQSYRDYFKKQYSQQVAQLQQQLSSSAALVPDIDKQVKYSWTLIVANGKLMETGDVRITDFILSINNYISAKNLLQQNYISRLQLINQLNYWSR